MPRRDSARGAGRPPSHLGPRTSGTPSPGAIARLARRIDPADPDGSYLLACLLLASAGGFADAASYVLTASFAGHITGNTLLTAIGVVEHAWPQVLACSVAVASFLLGTAIGTAWPHPAVGSRLAKMLAPILAEAGLVGLGLITTATLGLRGPALVLGCLGLALGIQNGTLNRLGSVSVHGTYITGMSTSLVVALVKRGPDDERVVLPLVIGSFVGGAFVGALAVHCAGVLGVAAILVPFGLTVSLAGSSARARRRIEPGRTKHRVGGEDRSPDERDILRQSARDSGTGQGLDRG